MLDGQHWLSFKEVIIILHEELHLHQLLQLRISDGDQIKDDCEN